MGKFAKVFVTYRRRVKARKFFWQLWLPRDPNQVMVVSHMVEITDEEFDQLKGFQHKNVHNFLWGKHKHPIRKSWHMRDKELREVIEEHE